MPKAGDVVLAWVQFADTDVQKRTKVGIGFPECIPKVEELIRFYKEKYFG